MEDQAMVFIILSLEVDFALVNQIFNTIDLALSNCIENWCLTLRVEEVRISSCISGHINLLMTPN